MLVIGIEEDLINICDIDDETYLTEDESFDEEFDRFVSVIDFMEKAAQEEIPTCFNIHEVMQDLIYKDPVLPQQIECNKLVHEMINGDQVQITDFCKKIFHSHRDVIECMKIKEPVPVKAEDITEFYRKATAVETSDSHKLACTTLFQKYKKFDKAHSHICYKITMAIRKYLLKEKADIYPTEVKSHELCKRTTMEASKGRIRYVGGYCIHQIRKKYLTMQQSRMYSLNILRQTEFDEASDKISILNSLREEEYFLKKSSCKPETLLDTSEKQNLSKGLVHIPDELFDFFEHLCDFILSLLTFENFQRHGEDLHKFVLSKLLTSTDLQSLNPL